MPCLTVDRVRERVYCDTSDPARVEAELTTFYEHYLADDLDYFAISPEAAPGLYEMLERLPDYTWQGRLLIIAVNGPVSFGMELTDEQGKPIFYHETFRDAAIKLLTLKTRWLYARFQQAAPGATVIHRLGEPLLSLYSSAFARLGREEVIGSLNACLEAVPGLGSIHCCANIDWPLLMDTAVDIIDFDAYEFADRLALYPGELQAYLDRGGMVSWGLVPANNDKLSGETVDSLVERFERSVASWEAHGLDRDQVLDASFIGPSCSLSTMTEELAERAFDYVCEVSARLRSRYFG